MIIVFMLASAVGAIARFALERISALRFGDRFPWGTLTANLVGSAVLGALAATSLDRYASIAVAGFCGAFTTFGGFTAQTHARLLRSHDRRIGIVYGVVTVVGSLAAAAAGYSLG